LKRDKNKKLKYLIFRREKSEKLEKLMKKPNVIDARRILNPKKFKNINFKAIGLGI